MFKKFSLSAILIALATSALVAIFAVSYAQATSSVESISSYNSDIVVNTDNSIDVTETIVYEGGSSSHHGIYRDIRTLSSEGRMMSIEDISVSDQQGLPYKYQVSNSPNDVNIRIGDPNTTFTGQKTYVIHYHATYAVAQNDTTVDEIYWNVTGNDWGMPISEARASVTLPANTVMSQSACYFGPEKSATQCVINDQVIIDATSKRATYTFSAPTVLGPNEGLTVAVGFPKGVVTPYTQGEGIPSPFNNYSVWIIAGLLPILTLIFSLIYWYKKGRDPKGTGVIIAQYDVPDGLTPMEVGGIINQKVSGAGISAEIIYLATRGYLKITETRKKNFVGFESTDYELTKCKDFSGLEGSDQILLSHLFDGEVDTVSVSSLKNVFYKYIPSITNTVLDSFLTKGYYKNLGRMKSKGSIAALAFFGIIWTFGFLGGVSSTFLHSKIIPLIGSVCVSLVIYAIVWYFSPAKTEKGVATKEYLLGLKDYLQIAEKDRLQFHNAPEKKPEIFEALLPYAMILGVVNIWAKEFKDIYTVPPSWYSGPMGSNFNAIVFANNINTFSSFANSSFSPASSGSSGGGFSGGGGGGGGGGSW